MSNNAPITWACLCGQMNLWSDTFCCCCSGDKADCWDEADQKRAIIQQDVTNPEDTGRIVGFDLDR